MPYRPAHFLKVTRTPLRPGDFVMVAGYPGATNRYALADEFDNSATWVYPTVSRNFKALTALVHAAGREESRCRDQVCEHGQGLENS